MSHYKKPRNKQNRIKTPVVTKEGSLGLLALGYIGLKMWREKRDSK